MRCLSCAADMTGTLELACALGRSARAEMQSTQAGSRSPMPNWQALRSPLLHFRSHASAGGREVLWREFGDARQFVAARVITVLSKEKRNVRIAQPGRRHSCELAVQSLRLS